MSEGCTRFSVIETRKTNKNSKIVVVQLVYIVQIETHEKCFYFLLLINTFFLYKGQKTIVLLIGQPMRASIMICLCMSICTYIVYVWISDWQSSNWLFAFFTFLQPSSFKYNRNRNFNKLMKCNFVYLL